MSPDEIERTVQFLLKHQAQFAANLDTLSIKFGELTIKVDQLSGTVDQFSGKVDLVTDAVVGLVAIVGRLAEAQQRTDEQLNARCGELTEQIKLTYTHLDVVIEMFERHLREDHGQPPS